MNSTKCKKDWHLPEAAGLLCLVNLHSKDHVTSLEGIHHACFFEKREKACEEQHYLTTEDK